MAGPLSGLRRDVSGRGHPALCTVYCCCLGRDVLLREVTIESVMLRLIIVMGTTGGRGGDGR